MEGEVERRSQDLTTLASRLANLVDNQAKVSTRTLYPWKFNNTLQTILNCYLSKSSDKN